MDPQLWIQRQMTYDPMEEQRLQYMYEMAAANPGNEQLANAYNQAYMNYMFPGSDPMMAALGMGGGQGQFDLTPDFQTLYGNDPTQYTEQQLKEYQDTYGRSAGEIKTLSKEDGSTAKVFIDAAGNPTILSEQKASKPKTVLRTTGDIARQVPGIWDVIEGVNFAGQMGNAAFDPNVSMPEAYRGYLEESTQNNWRMGLPRKLMGEERFQQGLNAIYNRSAESDYKPRDDMSNRELLQQGQKYNAYLNSLSDEERKRFVQNPNDSWKNFSTQ